MQALKITLVGGGSVAWAPQLVKDIFHTPAIADSHIVLYDINRQAAELTAEFLRKLARQMGVKPRITATDRRAAAFDGADYVIITISTGGLDAMARDIAIPEKFGIHHTVGDTSGPGGWARFIRNFDAFVTLAKDINRRCPRAVVLNYTNPMTTLTDVLARLCRGPVIGLCHGLFENLELIKKLYQLDGEDQIAVNYGGLNHFFWIDKARAGGIDAMEDLARRVNKQSFTDILAESHRDVMGFSSHREVATELFRQTGLMPYLGDRHTCEFFPCYITSRATMKKYKLVRTSIAERRANFRRSRRGLVQAVNHGIPDDFLIRSRETAADIISAHSQGNVFIDVGNVPNRGQIANLPHALIVETAVRVDRNGFTPLTFGSLPPAVHAMVAPYAASFSRVVNACFDRDRRGALAALRMDPVCAHLTGDQIDQLGSRLLKAHAPYITAF